VSLSMCLVGVSFLALAPAAIVERCEADLRLSVTPSSNGAKAIISWAAPSSPDRTVNYDLYVSDRPIDVGTFACAEGIGSIASRGGACVWQYTAGRSGGHFFAVVPNNPLGMQVPNLCKGSVSGIVSLADRTAPSAVKLRLCGYQGDKPRIEWLCPDLSNRDGVVAYRVYRAEGRAPAISKKNRVASVPVDYRPPWAGWEDSRSAGTLTWYAVTAVDAAGNESAASNAVSASARADLCINPTSDIRANTDLSISNKYPPVGKSVTLSCVVRNKGAAPARRVRISAEDETGRELGRASVGEIASGDGYRFSFDWVPERKGLRKIAIAASLDTLAPEACSTNNIIRLTVPVTSRQYYFFWYGDLTHSGLPYANVYAACSNYNVREAKRTGCLALATQGDASREDAWLKQRELYSYSGVAIDEYFFGNPGPLIGAVGAGAAARKSVPDFFVSFWCVGAPVIPEVQDALRKGDVDLVVFEAYLDVGQDFQPLDTYINAAKSARVADRCIVALGSDWQWAKTATAGEQMNYIEKQIKYIIEKAPDMPGIGFFLYDSRYNWPGVAEAIDKMCYKYFIMRDINGGDK